MFSSACLRHGLDTTRLPHESTGSVGEKNKAPGTCRKTLRIPAKTFPRGLRFRVCATSAPNGYQPNGVPKVKSILSNDQALKTMFNIAIKALMAGEFKSPSDLFQTLERVNLTSDIRQCNTMLFALRDAGQYKTMFLFLEHVNRREIPLNENTFTLVISACCALLDLDSASLYFDQLRARGDVQITSLSYRSIISACIDCNQFEQARSYFDEMLEDEIEINPILVTSLFKQLSHKSGHESEAARLCHAILEKVEAADVSLTPEIYKAAVRIYANGHCDQQLAVLYEKMKESDIKLDFHTYKNLLYGFYKYPDRAVISMRIFEEMKKDGIQPDLATYHSLLRFPSGSAFDERPLMLLAEMEEQGLRPTELSYGFAIRSYSTDYSEKELSVVWKSIERLLERMNAQGIKPGSITYSSLLTVCITHEDLERGRHFHEEMDAKGVQRDYRVYAKLLALAAQSGETVESNGENLSLDALLKRMKEEQIKLRCSMCTSVMRAMPKENSSEAAKVFMERMKEAGVVYDKILLRVLLDFWISVGDTEMADAVVAEALQQEGLSATIIYTMYMEVLERKQKTESSVEILRRMHADNIRLNTVTYKVLERLNDCTLPREMRTEINEMLGTDSPVRF